MGNDLTKADHGLTVTHVYGTLGLIAGLMGLIASYKGSGGIYGWLLLASGWLACAFLTWFLVKVSKQLTDIISSHDEEIARYAARVASLEATVEQQRNLIDQRSATLDYLSSQLMNRPATPRMSTQSPLTKSENE